jgi:hypothetical protein
MSLEKKYESLNSPSFRKMKKEVVIRSNSQSPAGQFLIWGIIPLYFWTVSPGLAKQQAGLQGQQSF